MATNDGFYTMSKGRRKQKRLVFPPDVLFHSMSQRKMKHLKVSPSLRYSKGKAIFFSKTEEYAWQIAHRSFTDPEVAIIDVPKARRNNIVFFRNKRNLWQTNTLPSQSIINTDERYSEQVSAGGIPIYFAADGPKVALIQVKRPFSLTWELAKGKLEIGESPRQAAIREVGEEMGVNMRLKIIDELGVVRFVMYTPDGSPRLKTLYLYLIQSDDYPQAFFPATEEGVMQVKWFDIETAVEMVTHRSLYSIMRRLRMVGETFAKS